MERYKRQIAVIGEQGQKCIDNAKVMIVGLGGIGSPVAQYLAAAGVGKLILVDNDKVDLSNLHRQILFNQDDIGHYKAEKAKIALEKVNSEIIIEACPYKFDSNFANSNAREMDLIIDGTDNFETRYLINDICVSYKKVFISCSILINIIQLVLFDTRHLCYRCLYPNPPPAGLIPDCSTAGVSGTVTGMAGTMAAHLALNYLLNRENSEIPQIRIIDAKNLGISSFPLKPNPACTACKQGKIRLQDEDEHGIALEDIDRNIHFLVDIRQPEERAIFKLEDDFFFPLRENPDSSFFLSRKANDKILVFYCASGYRSKRLASELRTLGINACYLETSLPL